MFWRCIIKNLMSFLHQTQSGMSTYLKVIKSAITITTISPIPPQTNSVPDMVRSLLDVIIDSVINLHYENTDKSPIIPSPLSTAATNVTIAINTTSSQDINVRVSTVRVGNDGNTRATRRIFGDTGPCTHVRRNQ